MGKPLAVPRAVGSAVGAVVVLLAPFGVTSDYGLTLLNQALLFSMVVLGLNFIYGYGGILSLAQAAFWGIGSYTSALLTVDLRFPMPVAFVLSIVVASAFGILLGIPTLKLRSHYLTMATLGFGMAAQMVLMNFTELTHGAGGVRNIPPASLGPLVVPDAIAFYYVNIVALALLVAFSHRFRRSRLGRALEATRDDALAAGAMGVNVTYIRVMAFAASAGIAGFAGSLWAHYFAFIAPETFDLMMTIRFTAMLLVGGSGTILGSLLGSFALTYLPEWLRFLKDYYMAIYGLSIVAILVFAPAGLVGLLRWIWGVNWVRDRISRLGLIETIEPRAAGNAEEVVA